MAADALYKAKMIRRFCHLAIGQVGGENAVHKLNLNSKDRKQYPSASKTVSAPATASSLPTTVIRLLSCVAPSVNSSAARLACHMVKEDRCIYSLCRTSSSPSHLISAPSPVSDFAPRHPQPPHYLPVPQKERIKRADPSRYVRDRAMPPVTPS
jgi:hypothetical protein